MFSFELDGKSMDVTLSNPVAGRGSKSTDRNEESLMLVISAMYDGANGKDEIKSTALEKSVYSKCVDKSGKAFGITHTKELLNYLISSDFLRLQYFCIVLKVFLHI